ncbi:MAG: hypothetical protein ACLR76_10025 [Alistipes sp.]
MEKIREIIGRFDTAGTVADLRAVGNGWINDTYRVMTVWTRRPITSCSNQPSRFPKTSNCCAQHRARHLAYPPQLAAAGTDDLDRRVLRVVPARK